MVWERGTCVPRSGGSLLAIGLVGQGHEAAVRVHCGNLAAVVGYLDETVLDCETVQLTEKVLHRSALQLFQHLEQLLFGELGLGGLGLGLGDVELYHEREVVRGEQAALNGGLLRVRIAGHGGFGELDNLGSTGGSNGLHLLHEIIFPFRNGASGGVGVSVSLGHKASAGTGCVAVQNFHLVGLGGDGGSEVSQVFLGGVGGNFAVLDCLGQGFGGELGDLGKLGGGHGLKRGGGVLVVVHLTSGSEGISVLTVDTKDFLGIVANGLKAVLLIGLGLHDFRQNGSNLTVLGVHELGCVSVDSSDTLGGIRQTGVFELAGCCGGQLCDSDDCVTHGIFLPFL